MIDRLKNGKMIKTPNKDLQFQYCWLKRPSRQTSTQRFIGNDLFLIFFIYSETK